MKRLLKSRFSKLLLCLVLIIALCSIAILPAFASPVYIERVHNTTVKYTRATVSSPWIQQYITAATYISFWCESVSEMYMVKDLKFVSYQGNYIMYKTFHYRYFTHDGWEYPLPSM